VELLLARPPPDSGTPAPSNTLVCAVKDRNNRTAGAIAAAQVPTASPRCLAAFARHCGGDSVIGNIVDNTNEVVASANDGDNGSHDQGESRDCPLPHIEAGTLTTARFIAKFLSVGQPFLLVPSAAATYSNTDDADINKDAGWSLLPFLNEFGHTKVVAGELPYANKHGKELKGTTLREFFADPTENTSEGNTVEASTAEGKTVESNVEDKKRNDALPWIVFDNTVFDSKTNAQLRAKVAKHASLWQFAAVCGNQLTAADGLGRAQLSFGDTGSGTPMHSHAAGA
jgi:hypothetical protein